MIRAEFFSSWSRARQKAWAWELLVSHVLRDSTPRAAAVRGLGFASEL
jgi:hypothetical protein